MHKCINYRREHRVIRKLGKDCENERDFRIGKSLIFRSEGDKKVIDYFERKLRVKM